MAIFQCLPDRPDFPARGGDPSHDDLDHGANAEPFHAARHKGRPGRYRWPTREVTPDQGEAEQPGSPQQLIISRLRLKMPIVATTLDDAGLMALPDRPTKIGWYSYGPRPGATSGSRCWPAISTVVGTASVRWLVCVDCLAATS